MKQKIEQSLPELTTETPPTPENTVLPEFTETGIWPDILKGIEAGAKYKKQVKETAKMDIGMIRHEFILIQQNQSALKKTQRDMIIDRYMRYIQARIAYREANNIPK